MMADVMHNSLTITLNSNDARLQAIEDHVRDRVTDLQAVNLQLEQLLEQGFHP